MGGLVANAHREFGSGEPEMVKRLFSRLSLLTLVSLLLAACGGGAAQGGTVRVVSDLPMTGSGFGESQSIVNAIRMALAEKSFKACNGRWAIDFIPFDDASASRGAWDPAVVEDNAHKYVEDTSIAAVIGPLNSDAAKVLIPILNPARLVAISPSNTYAGLTKPGLGEAGEPDIYYPNGERNYARVIPADDLQGAVGAEWATDLGAKSVYILDDGELYGTGIADVFEKTAGTLGLKALGRESIDPRAANYKDLAARLKRLNPDLIYFGGITQNNAGLLMRDIRNGGYRGKIMAPDGIFEQAFLDSVGAAAGEGILLTFGGIPPDKLEGRAAEWREAYIQEYGSSVDVYAVYGYTAAQVVLEAFERVCAQGKPLTDRAAVRDAVLATRDFDSVLGKFSFDANGDTTITTMSGSRIRLGEFEFVTRLGDR
jgi:branched-chain amino acid transport system substrate-binding protein